MTWHTPLPSNPKWASLAWFVSDLHAFLKAPEHRDILELAKSDIKHAAALLYLRREYRTPTHTSLINICALALSLYPRITVYHPTQPVIDLVERTDLRQVPSQPPLLFNSAFILASRRPRDLQLAPPTAEISCYSTGDGEYHLLGLDVPDSAWTAPFAPNWTGEEIGAAVTFDSVPALLSGIEFGAYQDKARAAARFALVFAMLLEAEGSPIRTEEIPHGTKAERQRALKGGPAPLWAERRVYIDDAPRHRNTPAAPTSPLPPEGATSDRLPLVTRVTGYIRQQPHGPGGSLRKLVYVREYAARRWAAPRVAVTVDRRSRDQVDGPST